MPGETDVEPTEPVVEIATEDPTPLREPLPKRFAGAALHLDPPDDIAELWDVLFAMRTRSVPLNRLLAACIGLTVARINRRVQYNPADGLAAYGGKVIRFLHSDAVDPKDRPSLGQLMAVGWHALDLCVDACPTPEGIKAAADFSGPPGAR
jgi:hypothetical protein